VITGFITSDTYLKHKTGSEHPESPQRLEAIINSLKSSGLWDQLYHINPTIQGETNYVNLVHPMSYQKRFQDAVDMGDTFFNSSDNPISNDTYMAANLAVSGTIQGINTIMNGQCNNAFATIRPPGHHAEESSAMGFCFFNNVAIAARYAKSIYNMDRIVIIDFDVHHGNGTQHIFEDDPSVMYISLHRFPFYPGTGAEDEIGRNDGRGYTINYPLSVHAGDDVYLDIVNNSIADKVLSYRPDLIILSSGFDAHELDPSGGMNVTTNGFNQMTSTFKQLADSSCNGRLLSVLEGGYSLKGLADSVHGHLKILSEESS